MATYRGKHPTRINAVWAGALNDFNDSSKGRSHWCRTNNGAVFWIDPAGSKGVLPKLSTEVSLYDYCHEQERD